jgi:hypothetical protein
MFPIPGLRFVSEHCITVCCKIVHIYLLQVKVMFFYKMKPTEPYKYCQCYTKIIYFKIPYDSPFLSKMGMR